MGDSVKRVDLSKHLHTVSLSEETVEGILTGETFTIETQFGPRRVEGIEKLTIEGTPIQDRPCEVFEEWDGTFTVRVKGEQ